MGKTVPEPKGRRLAVFQPEFREDLAHWIDERPRVASRVMRLVEDVMRDPFTGIGKPEALKHALAGCWSRRITGEHRLVYRPTDRYVDFLQCRYHY